MAAGWRGAAGLALAAALWLAPAGCGGGTAGGGDVPGQEAGDTAGDQEAQGLVELVVDWPADGAVVNEGEALAFRVHVYGPADLLRVVSNLSGPVLTVKPGAGGLVDTSVNDLAGGTHLLAFEALGEGDQVLASVVRQVRINRLPGAPQVGLEPAAPTTLDDLEVSFTAFAEDPDHDQLQYAYRWTRDGEAVLEGDTPRLSASLTARGELWEVAVVARDGLGEGPAGHAQVTIQDAPPAVGEVVVLPTIGTVASTYTCVYYDWSDPDPGDPEQPLYSFTLNGQPAGEGTSGTLPLGPGELHKNDKITCTVTPGDGLLQGAPVSSAEVQVANSLPLVAQAVLAPAQGDVTDTFSCTAQGVEDADGDAVTLKFRWWLDGDPLPGETSQSLSAAPFHKGQSLRCEVLPNDGTSDGVPAQSPPVVLSDAPPVLASALLAPALASEETPLTCTPGVGQDPDGDPVEYSFAWRVNGVVLEGFTGDMLDGSAFDKGQLVECEVTPRAAGLQGAPVLAKPSVTVVNTPPRVESASLSPDSGGRRTPFSCEKGLISDPDPLDDPATWLVNADPMDTGLPGLSYQWLLDGQVVPGAEWEDFTPTDAVPGQVLTCAVVAFDGQAFSQATASAGVTLINHPPSLASVTLEPQEPREGSTLVCSGNGWSDQDEDSGSVLTAWYVNGALLEGQDGVALPPQNFSGGDVITCTVTPYDGYDQGPTLTGGPVTVVMPNRPPGPFTPVVQPDQPTPADASLECGVPQPPLDPDGDQLAYSFTWLDAAGLALGEGPQLPTSVLEPCQLVTCQAQADDGAGGTSSGTSAPVAFDSTLGAWFDGSARVVVPMTAALGATPITWEAWVRPDVAAFPSTLLARCAGAGQGMQLALEADGTLRLDLAGDAGSASLRSSTALTPDAWMHVAAVWDGALARLYVQGALQGFTALGGSLACGQGLVLGGAAADPGDGSGFTGALDEVRVSSTVRYVLDFVPVQDHWPDADTLLLYALEHAARDGVLDSGPSGWDGAAQGLGDAGGVCLPQGLNLPPSAPGVALAPDPPQDSDDLACSLAVDSVDPEGAAVAYEVYWYREGALVPEVSGLWTLPNAWTQPCERWACRVVPNDGALDGPWGDALVQVAAAAGQQGVAYYTPGSGPVEFTNWLGGEGFSQRVEVGAGALVVGARVYVTAGQKGIVTFREYLDGADPAGTSRRVTPLSSAAGATGWQEFLFANPYAVDVGRPFLLTFIENDTGSMSAWYDGDGTNPATVNWVYGYHDLFCPLFQGVKCWRPASDHGIPGDFLMELLLEGGTGTCP
jgi:hypothetical protein